jgi:hypothetical protein
MFNCRLVKILLSALQQWPEVVARGGGDGVGEVAVGASEVVSGPSVLGVGGAAMRCELI